MLASLAIGLALLQAPAPDTDTTVAVPAGARLVVSASSGEVRIRTWTRNQVRVQARHSSRTVVAVRTEGAVVRIETRGRMGLAGSTDFDLTVPAGMSADLDGLRLDVDAEGMQGLLKVGTLNGDLSVRSAGDLDLSTMNGDLTVNGARGRVKLSTGSGQVSATAVQGDLSAEAISGDIGLYRIESGSVDVEVVSGNVYYQGTVRDGGSYSISSHSGEVVFGTPESANATINTATFSGSMSASFRTPNLEERSRSRRSVRLGSGSALVELESFSGRIRLVRPDEVPTLEGRRDRGGREDGMAYGGWLEGLESSLEGLDHLDVSVDLGDLSSLRSLGRHLRNVVPEVSLDLHRDVHSDLDLDFNFDFNLRHLRSLRRTLDPEER